MTRISKTPQERKEEILHAARTLFLEQGYDQTSVQDIVRKVGVAQGTFYYHFPSKDACLEAVAKEEVAALESLLAEIARQEDSQPLEQLHAMLAQALMLQEGKKNILDAVHKKSNAILHERLVTTTLEAVIPIVAQVIARGRDQGVFHVRHPLETTELMISALAYLVHEPYLVNEPDHFLRLAQAVEELLPRVLGLAHN